jgi:hypothetical protein
MRWKRFSTWLRFALGASAEGEPSSLRLLLAVGAGDAAAMVADESVEDPFRSAPAFVVSSSESELSVESVLLEEEDDDAASFFTLFFTFNTILASSSDSLSELESLESLESEELESDEDTDTAVLLSTSFFGVVVDFLMLSESESSSLSLEDESLESLSELESASDAGSATFAGSSSESLDSLSESESDAGSAVFAGSSSESLLESLEESLEGEGADVVFFALIFAGVGAASASDSESDSELELDESELELDESVSALVIAAFLLALTFAAGLSPSDSESLLESLLESLSESLLESLLDELSSTSMGSGASSAVVAPFFSHCSYSLSLLAASLWPCCLRKVWMDSRGASKEAVAACASGAAGLAALAAFFDFLSLLDFFTTFLSGAMMWEVTNLMYGWWSDVKAVTEKSCRGRC